LINPLHHHGCRCTTTIANSGNTILAGLELMKQRGQNARPGTAEGMAQGDSTTKRVHISILETEDLRTLELGNRRRLITHLFIRLNDSRKRFIELPHRNILLADACSL
jgi:hypothetical protein